MSDAPPVNVITPAQDSLSQYANPIQIIRHLWGQRQLIWQISQRNVLELYRGSYLGLLWSLFTPLASLLVYTFVFSVVFQARWDQEMVGGRAEYALVLFAGLIAFNVFGESAVAAPMLIVSQAGYVKRVLFPLEILPLSNLISAAIQSLFPLLILLLGVLFFLGQISATLYLLPLAYLPLLLLSLGVGWFLASLGVFLRDMQHVMRIIVQLLFFLTPIFYPLSIVPPAFQRVLRLNPLTYLVEYFRQVTMFGETPHWGSYLVLTAVSLLVAWLGYLWFMKSKKTFADVV